MKWYLKALKQYADFNGRARRKEYWMFYLFYTISVILAVILDNLLNLNFGNTGTGLIYVLYNIAIFLPVTAVTVRRLHDVGKSGWMIFILLIPIIGAIWLLILLLTQGTPGENKYGINPKEISI